ncbi:MAG: hydrogenase maturation protease [Candidatus Neomarinimicrobiota bacterium]
MRPLVLGLGNDLLSDDTVGILAARALKQQLPHQADVIESPLAGLALLDILTGYSQAVIIDAICTGQHPPGTIIRLGLDDLSRVRAPTPHFSGLPEIFALAQQLQLDFPQDLVIFAMEVEDPFTIGGGLSPAVRHALPALIDQVAAQVTEWAQTPATPPAD